MSELLKKHAAEAAINWVKEDSIIGVGTGSTVNYFIDALKNIKHKIEAAVASSEATEQRLKAHNIPVIPLNSAGNISLYVDGADECNAHRQLIKGCGGALTREKIIAQCAKQFVCIVDQSKQVDVLGKFPLPIEVLDFARSAVARALVKMGGCPEYREGFVTDNGHVILDIYNLTIDNPSALETMINNIPGVVTNGIFSLRPADHVIIATEEGIVDL